MSGHQFCKEIETLLQWQLYIFLNPYYKKYFLSKLADFLMKPNKILKYCCMKMLSKDAYSLAPLHATRITLHVIRIHHVAHSAVIKDGGMGNFPQLQQM